MMSKDFPVAEYKIFAFTSNWLDANAMVVIVNNAIKEGWEPLGGISISKDGLNYTFAQAMTKKAQVCFRKLLKRALDAHLEDEGQCWMGHGEPLTREEQQALNEVLVELHTTPCIDSASITDKPTSEKKP